jgi:hypothetical protein
MTTTVAGAEGICAFGWDSSTATLSTYSNSYTDEEEAPSNIGAAMVRRNFATAELQPAVTSVLTASNKWTAHQIALNPAAEVGGVTLLGAGIL